MAKTISIDGQLLPAGRQVKIKADHHQWMIDEPESSHGTDVGPSPVQYLLGAVAGCLTITAKWLAGQKGIRLDQFDAHVEGTYSMKHAKDPDFKNRFTEIRVHVDMESDLNPDEEKAFIEECRMYCPVEGTIVNPTNFIIE